tara:strand:+ start:2841 stop:3137 length:297 start_codon:yes stop_codon:yes gene_type:complete
MKIYCIDIDGTLCTKGHEDYKFSKPFPDRINEINKLYESGNKIIIFTARGSFTGIDWQDFTINQLDDWGLKYHEIIFGKPHADIFIDDRCEDPFGWFD